MGHQGLADLVAAGQQVKDVRRQPRVAQALVQLHRRERPLRARLEQDSVAGCQCAANGTAGEGHREVERADHCPDAIRPQHAHGGLARRQPVHHPAEPVVVLDLLAVVPDEVSGLLDIAERLEPVLPDLHAHQRRQLVGTVADEVGGGSQHGDPLPPGGRGPPWGSSGRGGHRFLEVGGRSLVHAAQHGLVGRAHDVECGAAGAWLSADKCG